MFKKRWSSFVILGVIGVLAIVSLRIVMAHGSMGDPVSRVFSCYLEGPESPDTVACADVIASSGTQPIYDWNEVNISNAAGNHETIIPDGQLCSAGRAKYAAFDEPRTDWARTMLPSSGMYTFLFDAHVPHNQGYFDLYMTTQGYDPTQPLTWADLELFAHVEEPPIIDGSYSMPVQLPQGRSGHHVLYTVWQRYDSEEGFYSCSDVWIGSDPTPTPTTAPACTASAWNAGITYAENEVVSYDNKQWYARWSNSGEEPNNTAEAWRIQSYCSSNIAPTPTDTVVTDTPPTATVVTDTPPTATDVPSSSTCTVDYIITNQWGNGFQADVVLTNNGSTPISGWDLTWTHATGQVVTSGWNATVVQTGSLVNASNVASHWNGTVGANGGTVSFGFQGTHTGSVVVPTDFSVNGIACHGDLPPTATPLPPTATDVPVTVTSQPPTATSLPPTATDTPVTATSQPPTATSVPPTATPVVGGGNCSVVYTIDNDWGSGFSATVAITNNGVNTIQGYVLAWSFAGNQQISNGWNVTISQAGSAVTAENAANYWNGVIASGATSSFGFQGSYAGNNPIPTQFVLNGEVCDGGSLPPTVTPPPPTTTPGPSPTPSPTSPPPTPTVPPPTPIPGTHVDNPFVGAQMYLNPGYTTKVLEQANATGGSLGNAMASVANYSTAVWMDRIGAIYGGPDAMSLEEHLDEALAQQTGSDPMAIMIVIYDLPNRDCSADASNGELLIAEDGFNRYKTEYIDPIYNLFVQPQYANLRIITIIEPDSLPNLVTNTSVPACAEAAGPGGYVDGIQYALDKFAQIDNVYTYLDIAHSGWLGWDSNFGVAVDLYTDVALGTQNGFASIDGFVSNTSGYTPVEETFLTDGQAAINNGANPVRGANFYEWNPYFDELDFVTDLRTAFIANGFPTTLGMLVDTSRNGWGSADRPTALSTSADVHDYVDESRLDRRPHRGGWCNQAGAGIGERPTVAPALGVDAYVWVKPPGESDGVSEEGIVDPSDPNKRFDAMCDPTANSTYNPAYSTNALPNAPHAGRWFPEQFQMLVENAYPPLQ